MNDHVIEDAREITCIIPKGSAKDLVEAVSTDLAIFDANFSHARGVGRSADVEERGLGEQREKDVFTVIVEQARADEVFEYLFFKAQLDVPHNGFIYMQKVPRATLMEMPDLSCEE